MNENIRIIERDNRKIVEIDKILFSGKRRINWDGVEQYLKCYVGEHYMAAAIGKEVYIGSDFPDEYSNSKDTARTLGTIGKAKANAVQAIPELIMSMSDVKHTKNLEEKHRCDAENRLFLYDIVTIKKET